MNQSSVDKWENIVRKYLKYVIHEDEMECYNTRYNLYRLCKCYLMNLMSVTPVDINTNIDAKLFRTELIRTDNEKFTRLLFVQLLGNIYKDFISSCNFLDEEVDVRIDKFLTFMAKYKTTTIPNYQGLVNAMYVLMLEALLTDHPHPITILVDELKENHHTFEIYCIDDEKFNIYHNGQLMKTPIK